MGHVVWAIYLVCERIARAYVRGKRAHVCVRLFVYRVSPNLLGIYYESPPVTGLCTFHIQAPHARG
jgi:hypothetical protein